MFIKHLKVIMLAAVMLMAVGVFAQSPFKRLPSPYELAQFKNLKLNYKLGDSSKQIYRITTYRFTPFAGYSILSHNVMAGLGYGFNKLHWVDSIHRYYTDVSVMLTILAGGTTTPTLTNFSSVGIGVGVLNQLIIIIPCYDIPTPNLKGRFGIVISLGVPL